MTATAPVIFPAAAASWAGKSPAENTETHGHRQWPWHYIAGLGAASCACGNVHTVEISTARK